MTHIHDHPEEVLFNIFRRGCEELDLSDPDTEWNSPEPRRYPIICTARNVCKKWRQLVEYYDHNAYNKRYFWYTALDLCVGEGEPASDSVKRFSKFKHSLDASRNSDIWLMICLPWYWEDVVKLSKADEALLGLFMRCVDFIIPHQEQIVHYVISAEQPQFLSHLLVLLTFRKKRMCRRPTISLGHSLPPLSNVLSATTIVPSSLLHNPMTATSFLSYPVHLEHFDLTFHDLSWSDGALMKFPFNITNLVIPPVNLLKTSSFFNAIGADLASLTIDGTKEIEKFGYEEFEPPEKRITLPSLLSLKIRSASDLWVEFFLKHTTFPCLEYVKLRFLWDGSPSSGSNSKLSLDSFSQGLDYTNLRSLHMHSVSPSQSSIFCITHFLQRAIRDLEFELNELWGASVLGSLLEPFQLERLGIGEVHMTNWKMTLDILSSLNLILLQELKIEASKSFDYVANYREAFNERDQFLAKLGSSPTKLGSFRIKSPLLKSISFLGFIPHDLLFLEIILGYIDTRSLTDLQIDFSDYRGVSYGKSVFGLHTRVGLLPSILSLNTILSCDGLSDCHLLVDLLSFTPWLRRVFLKVPENPYRGAAKITDITNLFRTLTTHGSRGPLLPYLSSFIAELYVDTKRWQEKSLERMRVVIFDCLEKRHHYGAMSLELCDISLNQQGDLRIALKHV